MRAKKSFGQHFLRDESVIEKIIAAANISPGDLVVEIGPGQGALTKEIVKIKPNLFLVEADRDLIPSLEGLFQEAEIILGDAANVDYEKLLKGEEGEWTLVGNLPYNAAAAIVVNALTSPRPPEHMIIMVQKEHADRMRAKPGEMGLLSVAVQLYADVQKVLDVPPGAFVPQPNVDSMVIELKRKTSDIDREKVIQLAKAGFRARRKQLQRNLADADIAESDVTKQALMQVNLSESARAQELSIEQWVQLSDILT